MKIEIGRLWLHTDGVCYYGKKGLRIIFPFPIQLGSYIIREVNPDFLIRVEIIREGKKNYVIGYDDNRLGMVMKSNLQRATIMPMIIETICKKFKVGSSLFEMRDITQNGVTTRRRIEIDNPSTVDEEELRKFLSKRS